VPGSAYQALMMTTATLPRFDDLKAMAEQPVPETA
jgi:hypothetical protein